MIKICCEASALIKPPNQQAQALRVTTQPKLPSAQLSAETLAKVQELRAQGEQFHKDGKHTESMAALAEAKKLLGM